MGALDAFGMLEVVASESRGRLPFGALRSPFVNLVRTRSLEPGTVVAAIRRMNTRRNVIHPSIPGVLRSAITRSIYESEESPLLRH